MRSCSRRPHGGRPARGRTRAAMPAHATGRRLPTSIRCSQQLQTMTARFAPVDLDGRPVGAAGQRAAGAGQAGGGRAGVRRAVPAPGVGGQRADAARSCVGDQRQLGRARLHYFLLNKGPWSRLDDNEPFVAGAPPKPPQAQLLSGRRDEGGGRGLDRQRCRRPRRARATGFFTTIRRGAGRPVRGRARTASSTRASWRRWRRCCARRRR